MSRSACEVCGETYDYCGQCGTCHKCMGEDIDRLKAELEYTKEMSNAFMDERNNLKIQLAEARAEIERLSSPDYYACAMCPDIKEARQEAAKWVADLLFSPEWEKECHCCEDYYCSICRIKDEFKLEG